MVGEAGVDQDATAEILPEERITRAASMAANILETPLEAHAKTSGHSHEQIEEYEAVVQTAVAAVLKSWAKTEQDLTAFQEGLTVDHGIRSPNEYQETSARINLAAETITSRYPAENGNARFCHLLGIWVSGLHPEAAKTFFDDLVGVRNGLKISETAFHNAAVEGLVKPVIQFTVDHPEFKTLVGLAPKEDEANSGLRKALEWAKMKESVERMEKVRTRSTAGPVPANPVG